MHTQTILNCYNAFSGCKNAMTVVGRQLRQPDEFNDRRNSISMQALKLFWGFLAIDLIGQESVTLLHPPKKAATWKQWRPKPNTKANTAYLHVFQDL
eukprot:1156994-Pelagomonas_calceolata.AAC.11